LKLALISTKSHVSPRLGVALYSDRILDVCAAVARLRGSGDLQEPPVARTVKDFVAGGKVERERLEQLLLCVRNQPLSDLESDGTVVVEREVKFHPPIPDPEKFICVGKNYRAHLEELVRTDLIREIPEEPTGFIKLNSVLTGHCSEVERPTEIVEFDYEPELVFVIGKDGHRVAREDAMSHVIGFTLFNDLTAREVQRREVRSGTRFWTAKNMPGFGPIGPYIVTLDEIEDMNNLDIECRVNGEQRMSLNTTDQIFKAPDIIEHFSRFIPMRAGDLFATGSAAGVAVGHDNAKELFLKPGDQVEVVAPGVMSLKTIVVEDRQFTGVR